ncbi:hypothetical protein B0H12DRAFT_1077960 [Mycena haematopus]|nr:hypothetical protein B0H12DRAFT_1077960 [Mycena haematopus]
MHGIIHAQARLEGAERKEARLQRVRRERRHRAGLDMGEERGLGANGREEDAQWGEPSMESMKEKMHPTRRNSARKPGGQESTGAFEAGLSRTRTRRRDSSRTMLCAARKRASWDRLDAAAADPTDMRMMEEGSGAGADEGAGEGAEADGVAGKTPAPVATRPSTSVAHPHQRGEDAGDEEDGEELRLSRTHATAVTAVVQRPVVAVSRAVAVPCMSSENLRRNGHGCRGTVATVTGYSPS